jgi:beta-lactamase regulating signal transducer with metallopeptidase domain
VIAGFSLDNLTLWALQAVLVASVGALLPLVLRIRHPRSLLAYYHAVLLLCFALPVIQPWQDSLAVVAPSSLQLPSQAAAVSWGNVITWILMLGSFAKLCWLGIGVWQLRRYRKFAIPLYPIPDSIREATRIIGADALFCVSQHVKGPATLGHIDPIVLLPTSFKSLDAEAQHSIACHELLHVRRKDWLATMVEEILSAFLWFNPGAWWVLAQARLSREQLVDFEVVRLTAREPYVKALLSMAVVSRRGWAFPAASFLNEGHLVHRMRLLLMESKRSALRLCASWVSVVSLLVLTVSGAFIWFPLSGEAHTITSLTAPRVSAQFVVRHDRPFRIDPPQGLRNFTIAVQAPERRVVFGFVAGPGPSQEGLLSPPPLPPLQPGGFGFLEARGVRMFHPGQIVSPEEIERLRKALGDRLELTVSQAEDGTIERVTVIGRSLSNVSNPVPTRIPFTSAESAGSADRVD